MPLIRIDVLPGHTPDQLRAIAEGVHNALVEAIGVPQADRFQVISQHAIGSLIFDPQYVGISRTTGVVFVQITLSVGRTLEQKRTLFETIARNLNTHAGVHAGDVFINLVEVVKENWSFGNGIAQYAA
jgi:phenylpyruvate tautomerase PptA (4-oxalocrotonate tautomerase family)